jgi:glycerophosphoryl diester phosphodiesterase
VVAAAAVSSYFELPRPRLFGHRGAAGVAPENTLPSFAQAVADGAPYLELDVHATADGHVVVIHDATLERTTDGAGAVRDLSLAALRRVDAGCRFCTADGRLNIEVKQSDPPIETQVVDLIVRNGATGRVLLAAEHDDIMARLRPAAAARGIVTSLAAGEVAEFVGRVFEGRLAGYAPAGAALQIPPRWQDIALITAETVAAAHALRLEIHAWTINTADEMDALLDLGVDGIMTDVPALGRAVLARRGPPRG